MVKGCMTGRKQGGIRFACIDPYKEVGYKRSNKCLGRVYVWPRPAGTIEREQPPKGGNKKDNFITSPNGTGRTGAETHPMVQ